MSNHKDKKHVVRQGECLSSIAAENGLLWNTIWDHPKNAELKKKRQDPNILYPGDVLFVPAVKPDDYSCGTENKHRFVKKEDKAKLKLRLLQEGEPRSGIEFVFLVGATRFEGQTDSDGYLNLKIPPTAKEGKLSLKKNGEIIEEYVVRLGHLDPLDTLTGIQRRLQNLGFACRQTGKLDDHTKAALDAFRAQHLLKGQGIDDDLKEKLKTVHGS